MHMHPHLNFGITATSLVVKHTLQLRVQSESNEQIARLKDGVLLPRQRVS